MRLVSWIMACAFGLPIGYLIGTALKNAMGTGKAMSASAVALVVVLFVCYLTLEPKGKDK